MKTNFEIMPDEGAFATGWVVVCEDDDGDEIVIAQALTEEEARVVCAALKRLHHQE